MIICGIAGIFYGGKHHLNIRLEDLGFGISIPPAPSFLA